MTESARKTSLFRFLPHVMVVVIGVGLSFILFFTVRQRERASLTREFHRIASNRASALDRLIQTKLSILESVRAFFESSQFVEREEFEHFVSSFSGFEGFYAITWVPHVKKPDRETFEAQAISAGLQGFFIKEKNEQGDFVPAQERESYFPVFYIEPLTGNQAVLGYDLGSESLRYAALADARDNSRIVATEKIQLGQGGPEINSFLVFVPLYQKGMPASTVEQRREHLAGFVVGVFHVHVLLERSMSFADVQDINICLADLSVPSDKRYLCHHENGHNDQGKSSSGINKQITLDVATRKWSVICTPGKGMIHYYKTEKPWIIFGAGLLTTFFVFTYFLTTYKKTEAIQQLVAVRTEELNTELTQRKQAEIELARLTRQLKAKNAELHSVVYVTSHDLKSPLVTIAGFSNELEKDCNKLRELLGQQSRNENDIHLLMDETIPESLKFIRAGVKKTQMLIDGFLQVSRVGTSPFDIERIDMDKMIASIIENHCYQAKECNATLSADTLPNCMGDFPKTNQVFSNLIGNALKYLSPNRPGKVHISGFVEGDRSIYAIQDNGIGVPADHQSKIFQVFHRVDPVDSVDGEGLGLTIVSKILENQDGEIRLESEIDKGSKFYISLPTA